MKQIIAFPSNNREEVVEHFGHCKEFSLYYIEDGKTLSINYLTPPEHVPGALPKFLGEHHVTTIITGGMGAKAITLFKKNNIEVILGAQGTILDNLNAYLSNDLVSTGSACNHDGCDHH